MNGPAVRSVWRDRFAPKRTVQVAGEQDGRVVSVTLTDDAGEPPGVLTTNHTEATEWEGMYEPVR